MIAPSKRRWYQFSLRTLLAVMALASVASAWLAHERNEVRRRAEIIATIEKLGGFVMCDERRPFRPRWLGPLLGDKSPGEVAVVSLENDITDADMYLLDGLTEVEGLYLDNCRITDAGLARLSGLTKLRMVDLYHTRITDAGLIHLAGLTKLESLNVGETQITDQGIRELRGSLPSLRTLVPAR